MKNILVDQTQLGNFCGFGNIAENFAPRLAALREPDLHFVFAVPQRFFGAFGSGVDYVSREHFRRDVARLGRHIDLWHATHQFFDYRQRRSDCVQLLTVHDLNFLTEKHGLHRLKHMLRTRYRVNHSDYITVISSYVRDQLMAFMDVGPRQVEVIYNGISDMDSTEQKRPDFVGKRPFFVAIGQVRRKKNLHTLVPMMDLFPDHDLFICGDNSFAYPELYALVKTHAAGRVHVVGRVAADEKTWLYAHADALLFPSRLEGFGIPVLEAMRVGCRVVSSRFSCMEEICRNHAAYWDDYSPEAMAGTVRKAIDGWSRSGVEAQQACSYSKTYNYDNYTQRYLSLYRRLLGL